MKWMFLVTADLQSRAHARILQVLDNQRIQIHSFALSPGEEWGTVHVLVEIDPEKASHVRALLLRLESVYRVECFAAFDGVCRTVALFEICCDMMTQLPILQAASALGLPVVSVNSSSVVIQAVGSSEEIANFEGVFAQHGVLTTVAKATLGVATGQPLTTTAFDDIVAEVHKLKQSVARKLVQERM
jgi:acetolactate synthase small subunit